MNNVVKLAQKPTVSQEVKDGIIEIIKAYLKKAEQGEVSSLIIIAGFLDGTWGDDMSSTLDFPTAVGQLEICKQEWIEQELSKAEDKNDRTS